MENIFFYGLLLFIGMLLGMSTLTARKGDRYASSAWGTAHRAYALRAAFGSILWNGFVFLAIVAFFWYVLTV